MQSAKPYHRGFNCAKTETPELRCRLCYDQPSFMIGQKLLDPAG